MIKILFVCHGNICHADAVHVAKIRLIHSNQEVVLVVILILQLASAGTADVILRQLAMRCDMRRE